MKTLVCEMCGSKNLVKQDGVFACQDCGTKYSVEEAKKMMTEGTVDVSGSTVKVDNGDKLKNLYTLARRAIEASDLRSAKNHYEAILLEDPDSWEATLYSAFCCAECELSELENVARRMKVNACTAVELIKKNVSFVQFEQSLHEVLERCDQYSFWVCQEAERYFRLRESREGLESLNAARSRSRELDRNMMAAAEIMYALGDRIERCFQEDTNICYLKASTAWLCGNDRLLKFMPKFTLPKETKEAIKSTIEKYDAKIKKYDPSHEESEVQSGGCYVATAVYGSYDCPQVWTLRRFRDNTLASTWYGRAFVRTYYAISPTLVKWFGHTEWFKRLWRGKLDWLVARLKASGVADTPYQDRHW